MIEQDALPVDARSALVRRVVGSPTFARSPRMRDFLIYIGDCAIHSRLDELKEYEIGRRVFHRRDDYNPAEDNIVRVEARHLRRKLAEYFEGEGKEESVAITIPKGSYLPVFEPRPATAPAVPPASRAAGLRFFWLVPAALCGLLAGWLLHTPRPVVPERNALWAALFGKGQSTVFVCSDSNLVLLQQVTRQPITLETYLSPEYAGRSLTLQGDLTSELSPNKLHTSIADVHLVERIRQLNNGAWEGVTVRAARTMRLQDFKNGNAIILGSSRSNPWNELFEKQLKFRYEYDSVSRRLSIRDLSPRPGERAQFSTDEKSPVAGESFSTIAFVPNLSRSGWVLMIGGTTMEGTEAAGEFIASPAFSAPLLKSLGFSSGPHPFEVLLKSSTLGGASRGSEVVAAHTLP